jgi:transcriptional regulator with XRE-family HTH domain
MEREKLKEARYIKGWSQEAASEVIGVTRNTFSQWERGACDPYPIHVHRLCEAFGKTAAELDLEKKKPNRKLKRERELRGWSQSKLGELIRTTDQAVNRWENGLHKPNRYFQAQLCHVFGKNGEELGFMDSEQVEELDEEASPAEGSSLSTPLQGIIEARQTLESQPISTTLPGLALESDDEAVKRRDATRTIGALSLLPIWEQLSQALAASTSIPPMYNFLLTASSAIDEKTLVHLEQLNDICWQLANDSQGMMVTQILPTFLPKLTVLVGHPSPHQQKIARLVTRGYILAAEVEKKNVSAMQAYCEYAVIYSQMTNDDSIKADALRQKATIALIAKEPSMAVVTYQQALPMAKNVSPLLRSRIYLGMASAYARSGQKQEALRSLSLAREGYPGSPEDDPAFLYLATSSDRAALHLYEALTYSDLHQPEDAWEALMQVDGMQPKLPVIESTRIEFLNLQAKTAALAGNMELSREYLIASVKLAKNNGYAIWAEEAYDVYMTLCQIWPHEKQIKSLVTLFQ